jgi:hypothetical protein
LKPRTAILSACVKAAPKSLETTSLHLDILSDLKRIHSHICSVAYPVLEAHGALPAREGVTSDVSPDSLAYRPGQMDVS